MNFNFSRLTQRITDSQIGSNGKIGYLSRIVYSELGSFVKIGNFSRVADSCIGNHSIVGDYTCIESTNINKFTSIASGVSIGVAYHDYNRMTSHEFLNSKFHKLNLTPFYSIFPGDCTIGNDVWIGVNSTILRELDVGDGAIIGANAVITRDVAPYSVVAGVPAKAIKFRFEQSIIERLLKLSWWDFSDEVIKDNIELFALEPTHEVLDNLFSLKSLSH